MVNQMRVLFLLVILLAMVCTGQIKGVFAAHDFIDWNFTPVITERDINPGFSPTINLYMGKESADAGKIYGGWSPATAQFMSVWDCMEVEFSVSANGIDPRKLKAAQLSLDGKTWYDCQFVDGKGFIFRAPVSIFGVRGIREPKMRIAGYFRDNRLQVFLLVFRWSSMRDLFGVLHFMIKETPKGAEKLGRFDVYSYPSRAIEGVIPAWTEEPRTIFPGEEKLTISIVDQFGKAVTECEFEIKYSQPSGSEKINRYKLKGNCLWVNGRKYIIPDPTQLTFIRPAPEGSHVQVWFAGQCWSTPYQILKGHELFLKFVAVKEIFAVERYTASLVTNSSFYQVWTWGRMNGDPRYLGLIKDDERSSAEQKAQLWFQGSLAAADMSAHGLNAETIRQMQVWAKERGVVKKTFKAGEVIDSGMTFGVALKYRQGPILVQPRGISEITVYFINTPDDYCGPVPGIVGPSLDYSGKIVSGCCNMIAPPKIRIFKIWYCMSKVVYTATKEAITIVMKSPEQPVAYIGFEKPSYETISVALCTVVKVTVPDYQFTINVDASDCIDISNVINNQILNEIFNNIAIDITNVINNYNEVIVNLINQILNQNNNANAQRG